MPNYPKGRIFPEYRGKWRIAEVQEEIPVTRLWFSPTNSSSKIRRAFSLTSLAFAIQSQLPSLLNKQAPDLLIISSPPFLMGSLGSQIAARQGIPILLNISDLWPGSAQDLGFMAEGPLLRYLRNKEQAMYERAAAFCAQSEEIGAHLRRYRPKQPLFVYRNLQPKSDYADQQRPAGKRKVVYAGLLGIAQGVAFIASHINFGSMGTELHIYGAGNESDKIHALAKSRSDIFYHGSVPSSEIPKILSQYHIMLVPLLTKIEGAVPSKIFNAIANGLPLLYMGSGESAEIVEGNNLGYASAAGDMYSLKAHLEKLLKLSDEAFDHLRASCLHAATHTFSKAQQDQLFLNFLSEIPI